MAKLNYDKTRERSKLQNNAHTRPLSRIWLIGKYRNSPVSEIPLTYLQWVFNTFDSGNYHRQIAAREILRRTQNGAR